MALAGPDERAALTAGADFWHLAPAPSLGLPALRVTDGPNGARGARWGLEQSACVPCGTALAATWDRGLVQQVGELLGDETRARGAGSLLAPTINIHRHPLAGRNFECFSEDPFLAAEMAVAYISGVQSRGVACTVKHFVCNEQEHERMTIDVDVDERTLREIYLPPFEAAVRRAGAWAVMTAYNKLGGTFCSEHAPLLVDLLKGEWDFDGVVMSDWFGTHSTTAVAAGLDLEMPGPGALLGPRLVDAVADGTVSQAAVDDAARRVARFVARSTHGPAEATDGERRTAELLRRTAAEGTVLLRNTGVLPLGPSPVRVALIGPFADRLSPQGGGSAEVTVPYATSPLEGLARRAGIEVVHEPGGALAGPVPTIDRRRLSCGDRIGELHVEYFAGPSPTGTPVAEEVFHQARLVWTGPPVADLRRGEYSARARSTFTPDRSGPWRFAVVSTGTFRLFLDGRLLVENDEPAGDTFFATGGAEAVAEIDLEAGRGYEVVAEFVSAPQHMPIELFQIGTEAVLPADARQRALEAVAAADVAVVVVGADSRFESEGSDRTSMALPGDQDDLVHAVAEANPRTVVVVNAGSPVEMPWADRVAAVVQLWYPGQEGGDALADVLLGEVDPGGRLPVTIPRRVEDSPAAPWYPGSDGVVRYGEGVFVGYRHYDTHGVEPRFCFGHGLSYTTFEYGELLVDDGRGAVRVELDVTNTGGRPGAEVVQLYVRPAGAPVERPDRELKDFAKVQLAPGERTTVRFALPSRAFAYWDVDRHDWAVAAGTYEILVGASSRDIRRTAGVTRPAS